MILVKLEAGPLSGNRICWVIYGKSIYQSKSHDLRSGTLAHLMTLSILPTRCLYAYSLIERFVSSASSLLNYRKVNEMCKEREEEVTSARSLPALRHYWKIDWKIFDLKKKKSNAHAT